MEDENSNISLSAVYYNHVEWFVMTCNMSPPYLLDLIPDVFQSKSNDKIYISLHAYFKKSIMYCHRRIICKCVEVVSDILHNITIIVEHLE